MKGRRHAKFLGADTHRCYMTCDVLTLFVWMLYPIAWGLSEGGNVITSDSEAIFCGVLDLLARTLFSIALVAGHRNIDPAGMGLRFRDYNVSPIRAEYRPGTAEVKNEVPVTAHDNPATTV